MSMYNDIIRSFKRAVDSGNISYSNAATLAKDVISNLEWDLYDEVDVDGMPDEDADYIIWVYLKDSIENYK